ncbi:MAG: hypothetical protein M0Q95_03440 [Porticoccaceae bacterium]|nr:hypothetical protein [Porticoccaceae bacterium]
MSSEKLDISNYCACFIDLLGQRNALKGQSLLPSFSNDSDKEKFISVLQQSVGAIERLQKHAEFFREDLVLPVSLRDTLNEEEQIIYDQMKSPRPKQQRWSDGLVFYHSLSTQLTKCPMNAVFEIFMLAGTLCLLGLVSKQPIRGAIETSWGVELHDNELYGAVVANSYELESEAAQYPRIIVGQHTMNYLNAYLAEPPQPEKRLELYNRNLAVLCTNMTTVDQDGHHILNYLGKDFKDSVFHDQSPDLFNEAYSYICEQYELHKSRKNSKLALRYTWLRGYFHQHRDLHV